MMMRVPLGWTLADMSKVDSWRELPGGEIELMMKRLRSADERVQRWGAIRRSMMRLFLLL